MMQQIIKGTHHAFQVAVIFHEFVLLELLVEKENELLPRQIVLGALRQRLPLAHERFCWLSHFPDRCEGLSEKLPRKEERDLGRARKGPKEPRGIATLERVDHAEPLNTAVDASIMAAQRASVTIRKAREARQFLVDIAKLFQIPFGVTHAQRIGPRLRHIAERGRDQEFRAQRQGLCVERVILAEPQPLVISELVLIEESPSHQRFEIAELGAASAATRAVSFDEGRKIEPPGLEVGLEHHSGAGPQSPLTSRMSSATKSKSPAWARSLPIRPGLKEIIAVEDGDIRGCRDFESPVSRRRRPEVGRQAPNHDPLGAGACPPCS